ncbi:hypothetical protein Aduo_009685 [Ancylostoma duodenale]
MCKTASNRGIQVPAQDFADVFASDHGFMRVVDACRTSVDCLLPLWRHNKQAVRRGDNSPYDNSSALIADQSYASAFEGCLGCGFKHRHSCRRHRGLPLTFFCGFNAGPVLYCHVTILE